MMLAVRLLLLVAVAAALKCDLFTVDNIKRPRSNIQECPGPEYSTCTETIIKTGDKVQWIAKCLKESEKDQCNTCHSAETNGNTQTSTCCCAIYGGCEPPILMYNFQCPTWEYSVTKDEKLPATPKTVMKNCRPGFLESGGSWLCQANYELFLGQHFVGGCVPNVGIAVEGCDEETVTSGGNIRRQKCSCMTSGCMPDMPDAVKYPGATECPTWSLNNEEITATPKTVMRNCASNEFCHSYFRASTKDGYSFSGGCSSGSTGKAAENCTSNDQWGQSCYCKTSGCMPPFPPEFTELYGTAANPLKGPTTNGSGTNGPATDGSASNGPEMSGLLAGIVVFIFVNL